MKPDLIQRAESVYHTIMALPPGERQNAIDRECAGDPDLTAEVRSLLEFAGDEELFLAQPALGTSLQRLLSPGPDAPVADDLLGMRLGPYEVLRRVAAGGMGVVYEALRDDEHVRQRVAIKVVKRGMDSEDVLRRFRAERQTLAALNHPGIARLLDGGITKDGRPYLVMEFVEGTPIDQFCDQQRLTTLERVKLFRSVCDAVRAAHQGLVIHRDLKPSNILVTGGGLPKLLDFGISKVLTSSTRAESITVPELRRLTPEYASPEQVRGEAITTASDVYSLGVILYELLTGRRPYDFLTRSLEEIERVVCGTAPLMPSAAVLRPTASPETTAAALSSTRDGSPDRLQRRLRGDLDTIILACLHKDLARRYASVEALIDDLDRFSQGLPVRAHKDTLAYRTSKFVRRNPVGTSLSVLSLVLLLCGTAGIAYQASNAADQRDAAFLARDQAEQVADFFRQVLEACSPENLGPDATIKEAMEQARERARYDLAHKPLVEASVLSAIGRVYIGMGDFETAQEELSTAYDLRKARLSADHHDIAESKLDLGYLRFRTGHSQEAEQLFREALGYFETRRGEDNDDTSRALNDWGSALRALERWDEAIAAHERALAIRRRLSGGEDTIQIAESLNNLASVYLGKGDAARGEQLIRESLTMREAILYSDHPLVLQSRMNLATMLGSQGKLEEAEPLFVAALAGARSVYPPSHPALGHMSHSLGTCYFKEQKLDLAEKAFREAFAIRQTSLPPDSPTLAMTEAGLGRVLAAQGKDKEAAELLQAAIAIVDDGESALPAPFVPAARDLVRLFEKAGNERRAAYFRRLVPPDPAPTAPAESTPPTADHK